MKSLTEQIEALMVEEWNDEMTPEEKEIVTKIFGEYITPEYLKERMYGYNIARTKMVKVIPEILSLIEKKLMRGFDELENNDIDKSMEQWKNYKFIRNNIRDILK